ncbi:uncharacterized protein MONOS_10735 [Monocercomonoides exilis]|uniref:uncharacterized protein n=1 Tax=Monocercomonoides exilis TaxID=2049356 RepID=UPI0035597BBD|nr:hypothetical protein MONOS_10735 [Monocercomonoides exilis]|eukprot:MONOS_10735.1-p1 / transcript=MONOS_10735.1 / gene=MONOS_10735 / organism=Monocercomonoides_exilis_PA203 / gene_product=unspecified product / transcript_product=unspecified product / location=Mono_scaffold00499:26570-28804(-) / protein_length=490 / sequence_SO=supercontig / SO=protein_coding / is_pseudo=false
MKAIIGFDEHSVFFEYAMSRISPVNCIEEAEKYEEEDDDEEDYDESVYEEFKSDLTEKFTKLFHELEYCAEIEQKQKIEEMNKLMEEMDRNEFCFILSEELFEEIYGMIEEKKIVLENAIFLMKLIGLCISTKHMIGYFYQVSALQHRIEQMIIEEHKKMDGENENLLIGLCECYLLFGSSISSELLSICVPCLLKAALKKEENEETRNDVEMALLALSCLENLIKIERGLYLNETKEIIKHHQEHRNLTRLANQSIWRYFINRFCRDKSLEEVIVNEMHFGREATRELEELLMCIEWKRKEVERGKETKEEVILTRWLKTLRRCFDSFRLWSEEYTELIKSILRVFRAAKDNYKEISDTCILTFAGVAKHKCVKVGYLLESGIVDIALKEIQRQTMNDLMACTFLVFFELVSGKLKGNIDNKADEVKRKATKMEIFEKMEEEGYEDTITSFHGIFNFINKHEEDNDESWNISDYSVNKQKKKDWECIL